MAVSVSSKSADIRARLDHPVIDADAHMLEFRPVLEEYLREEGIQEPMDQLLSSVFRDSLGLVPNWSQLSAAQRAEQRAVRPPWWVMPTRNTVDLATAMLPKLLYERLNEIGPDFSVIYPSLPIGFLHLQNEQLRRAACRAANRYYADLLGDYRDRLEPVAVIPMHSPPEAMEELEYAVGVLGFKAVLIAGYVKRPVSGFGAGNPEIDRAYWLDMYGLDSLYDYDPFWAKCVELKVPVAAHSPAMGWDDRRSISNYMFNSIGHFAASGAALCKSLFFGGVPRRFPTLRFAFLEGGVGGACSLYSDLVGAWKKRNPHDLVLNYDPGHIDRKQFADFVRQYGERLVSKLKTPIGDFTIGARGEHPEMLDEWAASRTERPEDIRDLFIRNFYFGCEADDRMTAMAFNSVANPLGARLNAMFSSDIGHWHITDMTEVLEEAYELVSEGCLTEADFRDFAFTNAARFYVESNPEFFRGTAIEAAVGALTSFA